MRFIDIGVNLMGSAFDHDRETVIAAAKAAGVSPLIITGSSIETSGAALDFADAHTGECWATAGIHPHNARDWNAACMNRLREFTTRMPHVAVGECGLDYNRNFSPREIQRACFAAQLALAVETQKPVFLHERDAFDDFYPILREYRPRLSAAVVHCFTGGERELEAYLALDCHIGITGWICDPRRGGGLIPLVSRIPANRLLVETDAPYLLPRSLPPDTARPKSGRNEPRFLPYIAARIACALNKDPVRLARETYTNAVNFFGIDRKTAPGAEA
jgi:TatD DNase family protein